MVVKTIPGKSQHTGNLLFPVFLKLEEMSVLIVGGGAVALEKLNAILFNSPSTLIQLVSISINDDIKNLAADLPNLKLQEKTFDNSDLNGNDIVIIAINDPLSSKSIRDAAKLEGKLVNVADKPELCDFYMSSIVKKGILKIAISTNG